MRLRIDRIFIFLSIVFLLTLTSIYGYRMYYYYKLENKKIPANEKITLYKKIVDSKKVKDASNGLFEIDENFIFRGNVDDNYIYYSGFLWRIVNIDTNKNLKMITEDITSSIVWGYENDYENSYIRKWLNQSEDKYSGIFYKSLKSASNYLTKTKNCLDIIDNIEDIKCDKKEIEDKITLLSAYDYKEAGGKNSYLNISSNWWLVNADAEENAWYVTDTGGLSNEVKINENYKNYGVRAVITINSNIDLVGGEGSKTNPYIIEKEEPVYLGDVNVGKYLSFSGLTWKVASTDESAVKVFSSDYIKKGEEYLTISFSDGNGNFDIKNKKNIGYYLNNNFYNSLSNKEYIISGKWYVGKYNTDTKFNYQNIYTKSMNAKIGLMSVGEIFSNDLIDTFTLTKTNDIDETIYTIKSGGSLFANSPLSEFKIRAALYLNSKLFIESGSGSLEDPYILSK